MATATVVYVEDRYEVESRAENVDYSGHNAEGYGDRIKSPYLVRLNQTGPWRRVYAISWSNVASFYVRVGGERLFIRQTMNLKEVVGVWPK